MAGYGPERTVRTVIVVFVDGPLKGQVRDLPNGSPPMYMAPAQDPATAPRKYTLHMYLFCGKKLRIGSVHYENHDVSLDDMFEVLVSDMAKLAIVD